METKTFEITTSPAIMRKLERFFALLHWNSRWGHSAMFGLWLDGDGEDAVTVAPEPGYSDEVGLIGGVGVIIEIAGYNGFSCCDTKEIGSNWQVKQMPVAQTAATLLKNDEIVKQRAPGVS